MTDPAAHLPTRPTPTTDRDTLRDRIDAALAGLQGGPHHLPPGTRQALAEHLAAVLPAPDQQAAVLLWAADQIDAETQRLRADGVLEPNKYRPCRDASAQLRRLAGEAQQDRHSCDNCSGVDPASCLMNPDRAREAQQPSCAECGHPAAVHEEGDDPVTPGLCRLCPDDDAHHDYRAQQDPTQDGEEAHPAEHTWAAELYDPVAEEWVPGTRYAVRDRAVNHLEHARAIGPAWKDGTPTQRRLVRATTTYTVEDPAAGARSGQPDTD
ncbi:hypothetical protein ACF1GW_35515 [Streptomyces achromogenes]|uniref:hypothetical protein n=1 Tax=Streptomyces achromogenes TaxID=67255 RepID=UPI0036F5CBDD